MRSVGRGDLTPGERLLKGGARDPSIMIDDIDSAYAYNEELKQQIYNRGL